MWSPRPRPSKPAPDTGVGDVGEREGTCVREDAWPGVLWGWRGRGVRAGGGDSPSLPFPFPCGTAAGRRSLPLEKKS